jgi:hypothetical protein
MGPVFPVRSPGKNCPESAGTDRANGEIHGLLRAAQRCIMKWISRDDFETLQRESSLIVRAKWLLRSRTDDWTDFGRLFFSSSF